MAQLQKIITAMTPTTSSAADFISVKLIKDAGSVINPFLLHLVNQVIQSKTYPTGRMENRTPILRDGDP